MNGSLETPPLPTSVAAALVKWVSQDKKAKLPRSITSPFDAWLQRLKETEAEGTSADWKIGTRVTHGCMILFDSLPARAEMDEGMIHNYLDGVVP